MRRHSSILEVPSFRGAHCDTDHYLIVVKIRDILAMDKRPVNKKLNKGGVKEQYQVKIKNRFPALENLEDNEDIISAWSDIRVNTNISAKSECVIVKQSVMKRGLMKNVPNCLIEGSRLNYNSHRIQV
jgi:hypothetical protein